MAKVGDSFYTGTIVPEPAVYACSGFKDSGQCPAKIEITVMGPVFPPPHCAGSKWRLARKLTEDVVSPEPETSQPLPTESEPSP